MAEKSVRATEEEVKALAAPAWTESWHPVSHGQVVEAVEAAVSYVGIGVSFKQYTLAASGARMFGSWSLDNAESGVSYAVGFRNSTDQRFAVGVCSGNHVIACSNMMFPGDYIDFRRHTGGLDGESLTEMAKRALKGIMDRLAQVRDWLLGLRMVEFNSREFKALVFDAMSSGLVPPQRFREFLEAWRTEGGTVDGSGTLWQFHNAYTRMVREESLFSIAHRTGNLTGLIDTAADRIRTARLGYGNRIRMELAR